MATSSVNVVTLSADDLRRKFNDEGWAEKLSACEKARRVYIESEPGRGRTLRKVLRKYYDDNGTIVAVTIDYLRDDASRLSIRMLRDGDTVFSAPAVSATPSTNQA